MTDAEYKKIDDLVASGSSVLAACGGNNAMREAYRRKKKKLGAVVHRPDKPIDTVSYETILRKHFPDWDKYSELQRIIIQDGFLASRRCAEGGHFAKIWQSFAASTLPDLFGKDGGSSKWSPEDYQRALEAISEDIEIEVFEEKKDVDIEGD